MEITERQSIVIFFSHLKKVTALKKLGDINYLSKEMHYLILYVNRADAAETLKKIRSFNFVRTAYISPRADLRVNYDEDYTITEEDEQWELFLVILAVDG